MVLHIFPPEYYEGGSIFDHHLRKSWCSSQPFNGQLGRYNVPTVVRIAESSPSTPRLFVRGAVLFGRRYILILLCGGPYLQVGLPLHIPLAFCPCDKIETGSVEEDEAVEKYVRTKIGILKYVTEKFEVWVNGGNRRSK